MYCGVSGQDCLMFQFMDIVVKNDKSQREEIFKEIKMFTVITSLNEKKH